MAMMLDRPDTWTGVVREVVVPSPSWPKPLLPQAQTRAVLLERQGVGGRPRRWR